MEEENLPIIPPKPSELLAQQKVIINAFKLSVPEYLPPGLKEGLEVVDQINLASKSLNEDAALLASITARKLLPNKKTFNTIAGRIAPIIKDAPLPALSPLGTPQWTNLVISGETFTDPVTQKIVVIPDYVIYTCLITLTGEKNIITTEVQGKNGTIKEYIAQKDWSINIKGGIFGKNGQRPKLDINILKRALWNANISLRVKAPIFDEWDITNIVVQSINVPEQMGGYSYQLFEITALSDEDLILNLAGL